MSIMTHLIFDMCFVDKAKTISQTRHYVNNSQTSCFLGMLNLWRDSVHGIRRGAHTSSGHTMSQLLHVKSSMRTWLALPKHLSHLWPTQSNNKQISGSKVKHCSFVCAPQIFFTDNFDNCGGWCYTSKQWSISQWDFKGSVVLHCCQHVKHS